MLFPAPFSPTSAMTSPRRMARSTCRRAGAAAPGYANETSSNRTSRANGAGRGEGSAGAATVGSRSRNSKRFRRKSWSSYRALRLEKIDWV